VTNPTFLKVLHKIYTRLTNSNVNWVVTGSFGFELQGVSVKPNDIDIQTDETGAYEIERLFLKFINKKVSFSSSDKIRSHYGELIIDGVKVEIRGNVQKRLNGDVWEPSLDLKKLMRVVEVEGMHVPVLPLEYEYQAYQMLGRNDKVEVLKRHLERSKR
jgi:hypothetical protein